MRETSDLVHEMVTAAKKAWLVAIAVGFENETEFVFSSHIHPLDDLNRLIRKGGSPVGLLLFEKQDGTVQGSYRPFEEYQNEEWAQKYLAGLLDHTQDIIALSGHTLIIPAAS